EARTLHDRARARGEPGGVRRGVLLQTSRQALMSSNRIETGTRPDLLSLDRDAAERALAEHFTARRQPGYRARQALAGLFERDAAGFVEMTDLPSAERAALDEAFEFTAPELARVERSTDGTVKHLWRMMDG